jgi:NmrA-like family
METPAPANAEQVRAGGADVVVGDLDEPESLAAVFAGVDTAFIVSPMDERIAVREATALQAAQEAGVRRIVKPRNTDARRSPEYALFPAMSSGSTRPRRTAAQCAPQCWPLPQGQLRTVTSWPSKGHAA